jgi:TetR/AcrR family transcriptional regulator
MSTDSDLTTRDLILDAAERSFARLGFAATTIKVIGTEAGVNTALLYYYFADKDTLYREVLRRLIGGLVEGGAARLTASGTPEQLLRALILYQAEFLLTHPAAPQLIVRELIDHQASHAEEQIKYITANLFDRVCTLIERGQGAGLFRADLEPRFAAISAIAQVVYFFIARPAVAIMLRETPGGPSAETARAFASHAADFALASLRAPAGASNASADHPAQAKRSARTARSPVGRGKR